MLFLFGGAVITGCSDSGKPPDATCTRIYKPKQQVITQGTAYGDGGKITGRLFL